MDACLCQNLADAPQKMKILHSPFATSKTLKFSFQKKKTLNLIPISLEKKKKTYYLQTDLTKNMIDVNPKKRLKVV